MKDLIIILVMPAVFAFGYYLMSRLDVFIRDNYRQAAAEKRSSSRGSCPPPAERSCARRLPKRKKDRF